MESEPCWWRHLGWFHEPSTTYLSPNIRALSYFEAGLISLWGFHPARRRCAWDGWLSCSSRCTRRLGELTRSSFCGLLHMKRANICINYKDISVFLTVLICRSLRLRRNYDEKGSAI